MREDSCPTIPVDPDHALDSPSNGLDRQDAPLFVDSDEEDLLPYNSVMKNLVSSKTTRMTRNVPRAPHPTMRPLLLMSLLSSQSSLNHSSSPRW